MFKDAQAPKLHCPIYRSGTDDKDTIFVQSDITVISYNRAEGLDASREDKRDTTSGPERPKIANESGTDSIGLMGHWVP